MTDFKKASNIALWGLQIGTAFMFVMAGFSKLAGAEQMVQLFNAIGIGQWFRYLTGAIEVGGAALLLVPTLSAVGALLLVMTMIGAVITHLFILGGSPAMAVMLLVASAIIAVGRRAQLGFINRLGLRPTQMPRPIEN